MAETVSVLYWSTQLLQVFRTVHKMLNVFLAAAWKKVPACKPTAGVFPDSLLHVFILDRVRSLSADSDPVFSSVVNTCSYWGSSNLEQSTYSLILDIKRSRSWKDSFFWLGAIFNECCDQAEPQGLNTEAEYIYNRNNKKTFHNLRRGRTDLTHSTVSFPDFPVINSSPLLQKLLLRRSLNFVGFKESVFNWIFSLW